MLLRINLSIFFFLYSFVFNTSRAQTKLLDAIHKGDSSEVARLINTGVNVNKQKLVVNIQLPRKAKGKGRFHQRKRKFGIYVYRLQLPLPNAAWRNNLSIVKQLLEYGADPNKRSSQNVLTPVCWAAHNGNLDMLYLLLQYGAVLKRYEKGYKTSPLIEAAERNQKNAAKYLLSINDDVDLADNYGMTALGYAAQKRNFELLQFLLEKNAAINHMNNRGKTILELACEDDIYREPADSGMVHYLVEHGAIITADAFRVLCWKSQLSLAKYLIEKGLTVEKKFIFYAVSSGDLDFVKYLESTFNLDLAFKDLETGNTTLLTAARGYSIKNDPDQRINIDLIKYILSKKIDWDRNTMLNILLANRKNDSDVALCTSLLINEGAVINKVSDSSLDYSPLMHAVSCNLQGTIKTLIQHGAEINYQNKEGRTALMLACWHGNDEASIKYLVSKGADLNAIDNRGFTPAMNAVMFSSWDNIRILADLGADLNIKTKYGDTLLDMVRDEELKKYLVSKGAKLGADVK